MPQDLSEVGYGLQAHGPLLNTVDFSSLLLPASVLTPCMKTVSLSFIYSFMHSFIFPSVAWPSQEIVLSAPLLIMIWAVYMG